MDELFKFCTELGLGIVLTVFFVWQSSLREKRMGGRIDELECFAQKTLIGLVEKTTAALDHSTEALAATTTACNDLRGSLDDFSAQLHELRDHCELRTA